MPELTRYGYRDAISGFFEFPTENARRILPAHLEPVEVHHGTSIFAVTAFDFNESMVGAYGEVVMAVVVAPLVKPGQPLPEVGHVPVPRRHHHPRRPRARHRALAPAALDGGRGDRLRPRQGPHHGARQGGRGAGGGHDHLPSTPGNPVSHLYQSLHEGRRGELPRADHHGRAAQRARGREGHASSSTTIRSTSCSPSPTSTRSPFREQWMRDGLQTFQPLVQLETA